MDSDRQLRSRAVKDYAEMSDELSDSGNDIVSTTSNATTTSCVLSSSVAMTTSCATLVSASSMSSTFGGHSIATSFDCMSVTDLELLVKQKQDAVRKKQLAAEILRLEEVSDAIEVGTTNTRVPATTPVLASVSCPSRTEESTETRLPEPILDLAALRSDAALAKAATKRVKHLGLSKRHRKRSSSISSSSSSSSSASSFSDSSSSSEEDRKRKKKKDKKKSKCKSGKFKKPTSKVKVETDWPQAFLSLKYVTKAKKYESLSMAEFVAGYSAILEQSHLPSSERKARIAHLRQLMYLATIHR